MAPVAPNMQSAHGKFTADGAVSGFIEATTVSAFIC